MTRPYELMVILDSKIGDAEADAILNKAIDLIRQDGNLGRVDRWGRRKLAYEINKHPEGNYTVIQFGASPETVAEIARVLSITDAVLRHKIMRLPDRVAGRVLAGQTTSQDQ